MLRAHCTLVIEGERIAAVTQEALQVHGVGREIDAQGRVVMPGPMDAHVHVSATSHDLAGRLYAISCGTRRSYLTTAAQAKG